MAGDSERFLAGVGDVGISEWDGLATQFVGDARVVLEVASRGNHVELGVHAGLTVVERLEKDQAIRVLLDFLRDGHEDAALLDTGQVTPGRECCLGAGDCGVDFVLAAGLDGGKYLTRGRVNAVEGGSGGSVCFLSIDVGAVEILEDVVAI